jgi:hypothetical protein
MRTKVRGFDGTYLRPNILIIEEIDGKLVMKM